MSINILYPAAIDNNTSLPNVIDAVTSINAEVINRLKTAILSIETELGVVPSGVYGTVKNRLNVLENLIVQEGGTPSFAGDLMAVGASQEVIGFYGRPLNNAVPFVGQCYTWNGTQWTPETINNFTATGDLSGNNMSQTVTGLYNHPVSSVAPVQSAVPIWDTGPAQYDIRKLTLDDLGPAFAITGFNGGSTVEIGVTVTNPTFSASYSSTPANARITNTDNIDSPLILTAPFTSGTVVGSFHHTSQTSVTFTLTASAATAQTANQFITYLPRMFGGTGAAGATSSVTAGFNIAILSTSEILANEGLSGNPVGSVYTLTPTGSQKFYLFLTGGSHTFKDNGTGFAFPFNTPTPVSFTNQHGAVVPMYLYESTFLQVSPFNILVAS